jgi:hypothetical protein
MKQKLAQLSEKAMALIKSPAVNDPSIIAKLATLPAKLQQMQYQVQQLEDEIVHIESLLNAHSQTQTNSADRADTYNQLTATPNVQNGHSQRRKIRIVINWPLLGSSGVSEEIFEHMASDSLVKFLTRLYEVRGAGILEKLANLRVNRGFLVSRNPKTDYRYWTGTEFGEYQNQPIVGSGFFALTHSDTKQKAADIQKACQFLGFPAGTVRVDEVGKGESMPGIAA